MLGSTTNKPQTTVSPIKYLRCLSKRCTNSFFKLNMTRGFNKFSCNRPCWRPWLLKGPLGLPFDRSAGMLLQDRLKSRGSEMQFPSFWAFAHLHVYKNSSQSLLFNMTILFLFLPKYFFVIYLVTGSERHSRHRYRIWLVVGFL